MSNPNTIEEVMDKLTAEGHTKCCGEFEAALATIEKLVLDKVIGADVHIGISCRYVCGCSYKDNNLMKREQRQALTQLLREGDKSKYNDFKIDEVGEV